MNTVESLLIWLIVVAFTGGCFAAIILSLIVRLSRRSSTRRRSDTNTYSAAPQRDAIGEESP